MCETEGTRERVGELEGPGVGAQVRRQFVGVGFLLSTRESWGLNSKPEWVTNAFPH